MEQKILQTLLPEIVELIAARTGLHFPPARWPELERGLVAAAANFGFASAASFSRWLLTSSLERPEIGRLASHLTVGETYFFRDPRSYEILETEILPRLVTARQTGYRRLRLWSAGCATGEEAYSLAIALTRAIPDMKDWDITLLASDINPLFVEKAKAGVYTKWSFRSTPEWFKHLYFRKLSDGRYEILPKIKRMVRFEQINLADENQTSVIDITNRMDVIFCRNVLMYLESETAGRIVKRLYNSLGDGGWLAVSPAETSHILFADFASVRFPGAIFYRRDDSHSVKDAYTQFGPELPELAHGSLATDFIGDIDLSLSAEQTLSMHNQPTFLSAETETTSLSTFAAASTHYEAGDYKIAGEMLLALLGDQPHDARTLGLMARAQANQGNLKDAYEWCQRAIRADKLNPQCYYLLASIADELDLTDEVRQGLRRALYLDPDFVMAHLALGRLAQRQGRESEAAKHFETALVLLDRYLPDQLLPESEGITAGRLSTIIRDARDEEDQGER